MKWQTIIFEDGSNPYICKTEKEFEKMNGKYNLREAGPKDYWVAKDNSLVESDACDTYYDWEIKEGEE